MAHPFSDIPELVNLDAGRGLVRIPMERDVPFTKRVRAVVDSPQFRRLSQISQLGLTSLVYPGATHTRFEHALGVFHNALQYLWQLARDDRFCATVDRHTAEVLMVSALLHDLGHWPYCHLIEDMEVPSVPSHEEFASEYLSDNSELTAVLRSQWQVEPEEILDVLVPSNDRPELRMIRSILSGPIDIDKMDYLDRDSLHAGVPYGRNFDRNRLVQSLLVNEAGDGLAISSKGRTAAELMVFARYVMFSEVYWHHAVRSATSMFARAFYEIRDSVDCRTLFQQGDADLVRELRSLASGTNAEPLLEGVFGPTRQLHKRVLELSHYQQTELYEQLRGQPFDKLVEGATRLSAVLSSQLGVEIQPGEILIDAPPRHREVEFDVEIYFPKEDVYRQLHEVSPVVEALAKRQFDDYVKRVRVFVSRRIADQVTACDAFPDCMSELFGE